MALNIKSAEADRLARELADATGESITEAVTKAIGERLERCRRESAAGRAVRAAAIEEIWRRTANLPVLDPRPMDELLGYNENGTFD